MSIADSKSIEMTAPIDTRQMRNAMIASVLGWSLDLFDLFILLYVAPVRMQAGFVIWIAAFAVGFLLLFAIYFFHPHAFAESVRQKRRCCTAAILDASAPSRARPMPTGPAQ